MSGRRSAEAPELGCRTAAATSAMSALPARETTAGWRGEGEHSPRVQASEQRTLSSVSSQAVPTISADAVNISCTSNSLSEGEEAAGEQTAQLARGQGQRCALAACHSWPAG